MYRGFDKKKVVDLGKSDYGRSLIYYSTRCFPSSAQKLAQRCGRCVEHNDLFPTRSGHSDQDEIIRYLSTHSILV